MEETPGKVLSEKEVRTLNRDVLTQLSKHTDPDVAGLGLILNDIVRTTEQVRLENTHRAAACDALCGFLRNGASSSNIGLRELCTSPAIWRRILTMYFERNNDARARPMKQVLETLIRLLQEMHGIEPTKSQECLQHAVQLCLTYLLNETHAGYVRPAMFLLDNMLSKKLTSSSSLVELAAGMPTTFRAPESFPPSERLVFYLLLWARNPDIAPVCGKFVLSLCSGMKSIAQVLGANTGHHIDALWVRPVRELLEQFESMIAAFEQDILPGLLRLDPEASLALLHVLPFQELLYGNTQSVVEADIRLCLLILRVNDELKLISIEEEFKKTLVSNKSKGQPSFVSETICARMLRHNSCDVRLSALSILIAPKLATRPLSLASVHHLQERIWDFFDESDARVRNDFLSLLKRLFGKIEAVAHRLGRLESGQVVQGGRHTSKHWAIDELADFKTLLTANVNFLAHCQSRLLTELVPTASYQRHVAALKTLGFIRNLDIPDIVIEKFSALRPDKSLTRALLDMAMDPFEDIRTISASLLVRFDVEPHLIQLSLTNAETLMRASGRADHADGYGRLVEVSLRQTNSSPQINDHTKIDCNTEAKSQSRDAYRKGTFAIVKEVDSFVDLAKIDLERAVADAPLHGKIIALRYLLSSPEAHSLMTDESALDVNKYASKRDSKSSTTSALSSDDNVLVPCIVSICERVWNLVHPILCDDSPEGTNFLAEDDEDAPDIGIKDTLSYAWRALKEGSLLLRALLALAAKTAAVESDALDRIGQLLFTQLAQLRHRGAFSAVAATYATFCSFCETVCSAPSQALVNRLYEDTLACIQAKSTALTRRSAGLPALTTGLLCANPSGPLTARAMNDLQRIAGQPVGVGVTSELPQVHALNCLKDIFTNTKLGPVTEEYLSKVLGIAVECLDKDLWAIRNSGLMVLKALLIRLEEGRVSSNSVYQKSQRGRFNSMAYAKHPALVDVVLGLLRGMKNDSLEAKSSSKQDRLIERTFPAIEVIERVGVPPGVEHEVKDLLLGHLGSSVWAMRNKTAACLALILKEDEVIAQCQGVSQVSPREDDLQRSNKLHGIMLLVRHVVHESRFRDQVGSLANALISSMVIYCGRSSSVLVEELFHENLTNLIRAGTKPSNLKEYSKSYQLRPVDLADANGERDRSLLKYHSDDLAIMARSRTFATCLEHDDASVPDVLKFYIFRGGIPLVGALRGLQDSSKVPTASDMIAITEVCSAHVDTLEAHAVTDLIAYISATYLQAIEKTDQKTREAISERMLVLMQRIFSRRLDAAVMNVLIEFWGKLVATSWESATGTVAEENAKTWFSMLRTAFEDQNDIDIREAAMNSISNFQETMTRLQIRRPMIANMLPALFVIYDGLIDDDEDIRVKSAQCASWVLSSMDVSEHEKNLSPAAAVEDLLEMFTKQHQYSQLLLQEALGRMLGSRTKRIIEVSFAERLRRAEDNSTTLFAEERQNQFVNEYREAENWTRIAKQSQKMADGVGVDLVAWTQEGLVHMLSKLKTENAASISGPLGIFSRLEIFLLVARLLLAADFVLASSTSLPDNTSRLMQPIRQALTKLADMLRDGKSATHLCDALHRLVIQAVRSADSLTSNLPSQ